MTRNLCLILFVLSMHGVARAQVVRSSLGKDFWIAFPPTEHQGSGSDLSVFISSDHDASIIIEGRRRDGTADIRNLTVPGGTVAKAGFDVINYELRSAAFPSGSTGDCERAMPQSVHVISNENVAVYAVVRDDNTSDAWLVLPTPSLGLDHRVLSYTSEYAATGFPFLTEHYYPSQLVVVATEDGTVVDITLNPSRSRVADGKTRTVVLNKGQSYLLQAYVTKASPSDDLTGTRVRATKPIVVLGSHFRAQIPILGQQASRDILVEQMQSVDVWGKQYVVPPLKPPTKSSKADPNDVTVIRILTSVDSTRITVQGIATQTIQRAGGLWELPLSQGRVIEADQPIMVGIFDRSANRAASTTNSGDPSLIIVPPVEQYLTSYRTVNVEPSSAGNPIYSQHELTIFAPLNANGIEVDGVPLPTLTPIGTSSYGYAHVDVTAGVHSSVALTDPNADTTASFGILIYGYGPAESYGYTGGMAFEKLYQPTVWLRVLDTAAAPGDSAALIVVVDSIQEQSSFDAMAARELRGEVVFNSTIWVPSPQLYRTWTTVTPTMGSVSFAHTFDTLRAGDTVALLRGRAVLGSVNADSLHVVALDWRDASSNPVAINSNSRDGQLTIQKICDKQGLRLFDPLAPSIPRTRYFDLLGREVAPTAGEPLIEVREESNGRVSGHLIVR